MTSNINLRELSVYDIDKLHEFGDFKEELFQGYNYSNLTEKEGKFWFISKQKRFNSLYFSINLDDRMIGFLGLKEINKLNKSGKLGIVFDPNFVSRGYGTVALKLFLDYIFNQRKMNYITLDVNAWNFRAIKLYENLGFEKYKESLEKFENQDINLELIKYEDIRKFFELNDETIYSKIYHMKLNRKKYLDEI